MVNDKLKIFYAVSDIDELSKNNAKSLAEVIDYLYPNKFSHYFNDVLSNGNTELGTKIGKKYSSKLAKYNVIYEISYKINNVRLNKFISKEDDNKIITNTSEIIQKEKPDLIISLSPLTNRFIFNALESQENEISTIMLMIFEMLKPSLIKSSLKKTSSNFDKYIVIEESIKKALMDKVGIEENKIKLVEYPVKLNFELIPDESKLLEMKAHFELPIDRKIVIFYGRINGYKNIEKIVQNITKNERLLKNAFFVIIIRNNQKQYDKLYEMVGEHNSFRIIGFSDQLYEYASISDIMVTSAETSAVKQALMLKKPIIITFYNEKSEKENIKFIEEKEYGIYEKNTKKIVYAIEDFVLKASETNKIKDNYKDKDFKNGMIEVAKEVIEVLVEKNKFEKKEKIAKRAGFIRNRNRNAEQKVV